MPNSRSTEPRAGREADRMYLESIALHKQGKLLEAAARYRDLLAEVPAHAEALHMLGLVEFQSGHLDEAITLIEQSVRLRPSNAAAYSDLGVMFQQRQQEEMATACFQDALKLDPGNARAWNNLGNCLLSLAQHEQALACHQRALQLNPRYAEALYNCGNSLLALGRHEEAITRFRQAIALRPHYPEAYNNLSQALDQLDRQEEALACSEQALRLRPDFLDAVTNRAGYLEHLKRYPEAIAAYDHLLRLQPDHASARSIQLHLRLKCCDWRDYHAQVAAICTAIAEGHDADSPFGFLSISHSPALQLACARLRNCDQFSGHGLATWRERFNVGNDDAPRKLRIAYLSSDFREHPMSYLMAEMLELHDRDRFEIIGVSYGHWPDSPARRRNLAAFDRVIDIDALDDAAAASQIEAMGIDIAVDLNGLTAHMRAGVLARRPAPIQATYMGYPGSTGLECIDYVIADRHLIPLDEQQYFSEHVVYLPDTYQANDRKRSIATAIPTRTMLGLPERAFVFCCFNSSHKISPDVFAAWMRLLQKVEGSVLWLHESNPHMKANLADEAHRQGVDPSRIVYKKPLKMEAHLGCHRHADLFLDTLPYNAHTTASDALWTGLPVLTCMGSTFAGRVAASLLHAIGLPELITHSMTEYEALAVYLATHPEALAAIRTKLARHRDSHPLFDTPRFCRHIERAYEMMWQRHRRGEPPASIVVPGLP